MKLKSLREFKNASLRKKFIEENLKINLGNISDFSFSEEEIAGRNIENLVGATQIPVGLAGPLKISNFKFQISNFYIPLATTEGALVASVSRGCKAISLSGGATTYAQDLGMTRSPIFETFGILQSKKLQNWIEKNFENLKKIAQSSSSHLHLLNIDFATAGKNLFVRFNYSTGEAMGMNMATIATQKVSEFISRKNSVKCLTIAGNYDIDKKAAWLNFINGRGKRAWAEVILTKKAIKDVLKTDAQSLHKLAINKTLIGSALAGAMGFNGQFSNILSAIFAATGQDLGQIPEVSMGLIQTEVQKNGDLYFSVYLPCLEIGLVGGGTRLPTQREALNITGAKSVLEFAQVIAAAVLAGEISLLASQSEGSLAKAHIKLGRKGT